MTRTDPLMAMLRQLAHGKPALRGAAQAAATGKEPRDPKARADEGKIRADHFREQLRVVAQGAKQAPRSETMGADVDASRETEPSEAQAPARSKDRSRHRAADATSSHGDRDAKAAQHDWRSPEVALNAVISRLAQDGMATGDRDAAEGLVRASAEDGDGPHAASVRGGADHRAMRHGHGDDGKATKVDAVSLSRGSSSADAAEPRAMPALKVVVREQETHFQPVGQPTLLQKIVDRIASDAVATPGAAAAPAADTAAASLQRTPDAPVRMLTVQLDPPNLGTVTVRMRLSGDAIEVKLAADRHDTTQLLRDERARLVDAMQSAGYTFEIASIDHSHTGHMDPGGGQPQAQQGQHQPQQQSQGAAQFSSDSPGRQSGDAQAGSRHHRQGHDQLNQPVERPVDEAAAPRRTGDAVYL